MPEYTTSRNPQTIREFQDGVSRYVLTFINKKVARACQALSEAGYNHQEISEKLDLASAKAVTMLISRYGGAK